MVIGIETDRGQWVVALVAAGYTVYGLNPMSVDAAPAGRHEELHRQGRYARHLPAVRATRRSGTVLQVRARTVTCLPPPPGLACQGLRAWASVRR